MINILFLSCIENDKPPAVVPELAVPANVAPIVSCTKSLDLKSTEAKICVINNLYGVYRLIIELYPHQKSTILFSYILTRHVWDTSVQSTFDIMGDDQYFFYTGNSICVVPISQYLRTEFVARGMTTAIFRICSSPSEDHSMNYLNPTILSLDLPSNGTVKYKIPTNLYCQEIDIKKLGGSSTAVTPHP